MRTAINPELRRRIERRLRVWLALLLPGFAAPLGLIGDTRAAPPAIDFNRDIRPVLSENCFYCHGQDSNKRQAELRLDMRDAAIEAGAIVPNDPRLSELIQRIYSKDPHKFMPPPKSNRRLSADQKKLLECWIAEGAVYAPHWAYATPRRPVEPTVRRADWVRNPIDRFVLARLEAEHLAPSPQADRATLIKRLSIDLTGVPPNPDEVDAFVADSDPDAYDKVVDRLLASKHYGETWRLGGRNRLPARYADSNEFQQDGDTWQWIWRDWVVKALNDDLPFDQFTIWQLAGDLLPQATVDQKIASGFNRNHLLNGEGGAIAEEQRFVNLFDRVDTTATTWLGLTMACAQCHDHKFDPITQRDYYGLLDAFNHVPETGTPQFFSSRIRVAPPFIELPTEENKARIAELQSQISAAERDGNRSADKLAGLKKQLANYQGDHIPRVMVMSDAKPRQTAILSSLVTRIHQTGGESLFSTPSFLPSLAQGEPDQSDSGLPGLAVLPRATPDRARVQLNAHVATICFGAGDSLRSLPKISACKAEYPIHGAALDWLAVEFRASGWSSKAMHKLIEDQQPPRIV